MDMAMSIIRNLASLLPILIPQKYGTEIKLLEQEPFLRYPFVTWDDLVLIWIHTNKGGSYIAPYMEIGLDRHKEEPTLYITPNENQDVYAYKLVLPVVHKEELVFNGKEITVLRQKTSETCTLLVSKTCHFPFPLFPFYDT